MATPRPTAKPTPTARAASTSCEHEHGHGHDHRDSSENSDAPPHDHHDVTDGGRLPLSSAMVLLLALSFHSFLEGLGMGSAESHDDTLSLLLLIALHKGLAAFALGMSFLGAGLGRRATVVLGGTFALATPIGVAFGVLLRSSAENSTPSAVCVAAAAGCLSTSRSSRCCRASSRTAPRAVARSSPRSCPGSRSSPPSPCGCEL